jgi:Uma2 family endonuclease
MSTIAAKWSLQEYHQMLDAGILNDRRVELLQGEIIEMSPEGAAHSFYGTEVGEYLRQLVGNRAKIREAHPITLTDNSEPEPDIAIVRMPATQYRDRHPQPDDILWLIEISDSTLAKDLGFKKDLYASAGIIEYWVMDLQALALVVFRDLSVDGYGTQMSINNGTISTLALPDISIDVRQLFI